MTQATHDRERLKKILDLSDRLERLRRKVKEGGEGCSPNDLTREVRGIAGNVVSIGLPGALGRISGEFHMGPQEQMVLLMLINRRIELGDGRLTGREILTILYPSSYGILTGAALLEAGAPMRRSGAIEEMEADPGDLLNSSFRISDALYQEVRQEVRPSTTKHSEPTSYESHFEHLADLGKLSALMLRRANVLFELDPFGGRAFPELESAPSLDRRACLLADLINERLARTPKSENFPIVKLTRHLKLSTDEQMVLVALLLQECYYGSPGMETVDCVKMVSRSPEELLRKRSLLSSVCVLRGEGLVEIEESLEDRELTGEAMLPLWVANALLGETRRPGPEPIGPDTRLEFHEYLKGLGDSDQFFRDLDT